MVDVQLVEVTDQVWGSRNKRKLPWNKDPEFSDLARVGTNVDNLISIASAQESKRLRRLMSGPFARKFLLDQEQIFKRTTKNFLENVNRLRIKQDDKVDILVEYKHYALEILSKFLRCSLLT